MSFDVNSKPEAVKRKEVNTLQFDWLTNEMHSLKWLTPYMDILFSEASLAQQPTPLCRYVCKWGLSVDTFVNGVSL